MKIPKETILSWILFCLTSNITLAVAERRRHGWYSTWYDLDAGSLKEAVLNIDKRSFRHLDPHMVKGRIKAFKEGGLISFEEADGLKNHITKLIKDSS